MSERMGIDGFKWEEVEIEKSRKQGRDDDMYFYLKDDKPQGLYIKREYIELANIQYKEPLKLYAQGTAIFMLKKDRYGTITIGKTNGRYIRMGGASLARKLYSISTEFEIIEAADDYILFRPRR